MKKTTFFVRIFNISPCSFTQIMSGRARWMRNLILHPTSTHCIFLMGPTTPKTRNTWKNVMMMSSSHFSGIYCFWGSGVHQKYVVWVLVGCRIKFHIQWILLIEIWVKTQRDMSEIRTKKVVFFNDKYVNSTIMVDLFYWNSIGSWISTQKNLFWHVFL